MGNVSQRQGLVLRSLIPSSDESVSTVIRRGENSWVSVSCTGVGRCLNDPGSEHPSKCCALSAALTPVSALHPSQSR